VNTGSGGGGGTYATAGSPPDNGAAGGSGIVIIRYLATFSDAVATTGSPTLSTFGGYKIYTFTSSGSITW
jgi:hypothetical protein